MEDSRKGKKLDVGNVAFSALREGLTNQEVLQKVLKAYPNARTNVSCISWYRNKLRALGEPIPTARALTKARRLALKDLVHSTIQAHAA